VSVKDRIKWWNIHPGDKVRVVAGGLKDTELVREVLSVDKKLNRVYLKGTKVSKYLGFGQGDVNENSSCSEVQQTMKTATTQRDTLTTQTFSCYWENSTSLQLRAATNL